MCQKPIGYGLYVNGKGPRLIHSACLDEADLKDTDFIPAGRWRRSEGGQQRALRIKSTRAGAPEPHYLSILCRRNNSVPQPSLARICMGMWLASSEYQTHTLPLLWSRPLTASAVTRTA
jgi:hypothetical protein